MFDHICTGLENTSETLSFVPRDGNFSNRWHLSVREIGKVKVCDVIPPYGKSRILFFFVILPNLCCPRQRPDLSSHQNYPKPRKTRVVFLPCQKYRNFWGILIKYRLRGLLSTYEDNSGVSIISEIFRNIWGTSRKYRLRKILKSMYEQLLENESVDFHFKFRSVSLLYNTRFLVNYT